MIFDTHTHYDDPRFDPDRDALLRSLPGCGIGRAAAVAADLASSRRALALAEDYDFFCAVIGVHPDSADELEARGEAKTERTLRELAAHPKCRGVGEIGLDYHGETVYPDKVPRPVQRKWFRFQLDFMREQGLPGVIHSREAAADTLNIIRAAGGSDLSLVHHCFGYEKEMAKIYLDMGHFLGIGGVVTYKNGRKLKEVVQYMPLDRILLETDCPYLAPEPYRGSRNDSRRLSFVVAEIARLKGISREEVGQVTFENAMRFYRLTEDEA